MTDYGVTESGFVKKTLTDILSEIKEAELDQISSTLNLLDTSVLGQLNGIFGDKIRELWDLAEAVYRAAYPDSASDEALDNVSSITGAIRLKATKGKVTLDQLFTDNGTTIPAGSIVSVGSDGARFVTTESVTNSTGAEATLSAEAEAQAFGEIPGYAGSIDTIQTPISGWNAKAAITCANAESYNLDGKSLTLKVNRGSEQTVNFSAGDPWTAGDVAFQIEQQTTDVDAYDAKQKVRVASLIDGTGSAIQITGGTANAILGFDTSEVKGFNSADADEGRELETDPEFRLRRIELLEIAGSGTFEAIRARVREISGVIQAYVFENVDIDTVGGMLPKSFEVVVLGGDDQEIAETIWQHKPAGIQAMGTTTKYVDDSQGFSHVIEFSRPTAVPIYIEVSILVDAELFPDDGDDQVKAALKAKGDLLDIGEDVISLRFKCVPLDVAGVIDVTAWLIDDVDPPLGSGNITIDYRDLATFDTANIDVDITYS